MNNTLVEKTSNLLSELPEEKERVDRSDEEMKAGIYYTEDEVWD